MVAEQDTRLRILAAAKGVLMEAGYANLSTRGIAEAAGVPLSQIHYHFGSKQKLMLAVLDMENRARLARQEALFESDKPLWEQWLQACDFFDDDLESGYVRVLMEMTAAGWSNPEIAEAVSAQVQGWFDLLAEVAQRAAKRFGLLSPFTPEELAALAGLPFLGAEAVILLGLDDSKIAGRPALRKIGDLLRVLEERPERRKSPGGPATPTAMGSSFVTVPRSGMSATERAGRRSCCCRPGRSCIRGTGRCRSPIWRGISRWCVLTGGAAAAPAGRPTRAPTATWRSRRMRWR
jgi:AcrR family transcriptional regulator